MKIRITAKASKQLKKLSRFDQIAIAKKVRLVNKKGLKKLKGAKDVYRVRVGSYRIVFKQEGLIYTIVLIGHRKEIYQLLSQLNMI
jgi:mRNA interferase RelE/StbE